MRRCRRVPSPQYPWVGHLDGTRQRRRAAAWQLCSVSAFKDKFLIFCSFPPKAFFLSSPSVFFCFSFRTTEKIHAKPKCVGSPVTRPHTRAGPTPTPTPTPRTPTLPPVIIVRTMQAGCRGLAGTQSSAHAHALVGPLGRLTTAVDLAPNPTLAGRSLTLTGRAADALGPLVVANLTHTSLLFAPENATLTLQGGASGTADVLRHLAAGVPALAGGEGAAADQVGMVFRMHAPSSTPSPRHPECF